MKKENPHKIQPSIPEPNNGKGRIDGVRGTPVSEVSPAHNRCPAEITVGEYNNAAIILGPDRFASCESGYGGQGAQGASAIDLVAGRAAWEKEGPDPDILYDTNFKGDAARIYISQKADIDRYFELNITPNGIYNSKGRSAIALKADAVRIIGTEGIKLVTKTVKRNSQGEVITTIPGIELIAGNDTEPNGRKKVMQAIVKADNTARALEATWDMIGSLSNAMVSTFDMIQQDLNFMASHVHAVPPASPFAPVLTGPTVGGRFIFSIENSVAKMWMNQMRSAHKHFTGPHFRTTYTSPQGEYYIGSAFNKTN